jgi:pilus assembly protein Flp/PilA
MEMLPYFFIIIKGLTEESLEMDERGQTLVEYALLLMLIAIVVIGAVLLVGEQTNSLYQRVVDEWPSP